MELLLEPSLSGSPSRNKCTCCTGPTQSLPIHRQYATALTHRLPQSCARSCLMYHMPADTSHISTTTTAVPQVPHVLCEGRGHSRKTRHTRHTLTHLSTALVQVAQATQRHTLCGTACSTHPTFVGLLMETPSSHVPATTMTAAHHQTHTHSTHTQDNPTQAPSSDVVLLVAHGRCSRLQRALVLHAQLQQRVAHHADAHLCVRKCDRHAAAVMQCMEDCGETW